MHVQTTTPPLVAGFALPDAPFHQGCCGNGRSELPPDPWTFLRPAAAPYVSAAVVYSDPDPVLPQGYQRVVRSASDVRFAVSRLSDPPHKEDVICHCLSASTRALYLELEPHFDVERILGKVPNLNRLHIHNDVTAESMATLLSRPGLSDLTLIFAPKQRRSE